MDRNRQTATHNYEIATMWETKPRMTPQKTCQLLWDWKRSQGLKPCQLYDDDEQFMMGRGLGCRSWRGFSTPHLWKTPQNTIFNKYVCLDNVSQCSNNKTQYMYMSHLCIKNILHFPHFWYIFWSGHIPEEFTLNKLLLLLLTLLALLLLLVLLLLPPPTTTNNHQYHNWCHNLHHHHCKTMAAVWFRQVLAG
jgi:hypothetical protein